MLTHCQRAPFESAIIVDESAKYLLEACCNEKTCDVDINGSGVET